MKRSPLRRASKKRAKQLRVYSALRKTLLVDAFCEFPDGVVTIGMVDSKQIVTSVGCTHRATQIHHIKGRYGTLLVDKNNLMLLCPEHHAWIHDNAKEARKRGLLK